MTWCTLRGFHGLRIQHLEKMPALNGRVTKAVKLCLAGDVELHADKTALVVSLSDPTKAYQVSPGLCQCKDYGQAPEHLCCHRLAVGFARKVEELLAAEAPPADQADNYQLETFQVLPEAPCSINVRLLIDGRDCQLTLRDTDETRLLQRL